MPLLRVVGRLLYGAGMTDERKDFVSLKKNKVDSENWQIKILYTSHIINKISSPFEKKNAIFLKSLSKCYLVRQARI